MIIAWAHEPPQTVLPEGFLYVGENNYAIVRSDSEAIRYLYSDSATSCMIVILEGRDHRKRPLTALAHVSSPERLQAFSELTDQHFRGPAALFALGANPPAADASKQNSRALMAWIQAQTPSGQIDVPGTRTWHLDQVTLALGFRGADKARSGCAGIDARTRCVSTQAYALTGQQRDPTAGVQTLFAIFGLALEPPLILHDATQELTPDTVAQLVRVARNAQWERVAGLDDGRLLALFSSTPDDEPPWFCDNLRASAAYVRNVGGIQGRR